MMNRVFILTTAQWSLVVIRSSCTAHLASRICNLSCSSKSSLSAIIRHYQFNQTTCIDSFGHRLQWFEYCHYHTKYTRFYLLPLCAN
ncbi:hypothetical protein BD769DRAFT_213709 [Suillus cothurnatus]|nr:hypothetical protein BD769DRAFT_213709 [Suillus cothurnatus]